MSESVVAGRITALVSEIEAAGVGSVRNVQMSRRTAKALGIRLSLDAEPTLISGCPVVHDDTLLDRVVRLDVDLKGE